MCKCWRITVELQWLEHLGNHENMFETGVVRANECYQSIRSGGIIRTFSLDSLKRRYVVFSH